MSHGCVVEVLRIIGRKQAQIVSVASVLDQLHIRAVGQIDYRKDTQSRRIGMQGIRESQ
jgi:hypothetical protein